MLRKSAVPVYAALLISSSPYLIAANGQHAYAQDTQPNTSNTSAQQQPNASQQQPNASQQQPNASQQQPNALAQQQPNALAQQQPNTSAQQQPQSDPANLSNAAPDTQPVLRPPVQELPVPGITNRNETGKNETGREKKRKNGKPPKPLDGMGTPDLDWVEAGKAEPKDIQRARRKLQALAGKTSNLADSGTLKEIVGALIDGNANKLLSSFMAYKGKDPELKTLVSELNETLSKAHADVKAETSDGNIRILMGASPFALEFRLPSSSLAVRGLIHEGEKLVLQDGELKDVDANVHAKLIGNHVAMQMTGDMGGPVTRDQ